MEGVIVIILGNGHGDQKIEAFTKIEDAKKRLKGLPFLAKDKYSFDQINSYLKKVELS